MSWTSQPKCYPDLQMNWETRKYEMYHASASLLGLCRQHPTDRDDEVKSEPAKKREEVMEKFNQAKLLFVSRM